MKNKIEIRAVKNEENPYLHCGEGVTIWINNRWVLDASCFTKDFKIRIDTTRLKKIKEIKGKYGKIIYKLDRRKTK